MVGRITAKYDQDLLRRLGESSIRLEENTKQLSYANEKIADAMGGIKSSVESLNDNLIYHTQAIEKLDVDCHQTNASDKERLWKLISFLLGTLLLVLGVKEALPLILGGG